MKECEEWMAKMLLNGKGVQLSDEWLKINDIFIVHNLMVIFFLADKICS